MIDYTPMPVLEIRQGKRRSVIQCDSSYFAGRRNFLKFPFVACQLVLAKRQVTWPLMQTQILSFCHFVIIWHMGTLDNVRKTTWDIVWDCLRHYCVWFSVFGRWTIWIERAECREQSKGHGYTGLIPAAALTRAQTDPIERCTDFVQASWQVKDCFVSSPAMSIHLCCHILKINKSSGLRCENSLCFCSC